jgi:PAS domain-containing protein
MSSPPVQPSAEALTRLMLLQGMLGQLPDQRAVCDFVRRGLEDVPGVRGVRYLDSEAMRADVSTTEDRQFLIEYSGRSYGAMVVSLAEHALFEPYEAYIRNLCFMVAAVLEERRQRAVSAAHRNDLELQVKARTQQLLEEIAIREAAQRRAIAERARAEQYLAVAEVIIVELDHEGRIEMVNPRGCAMLGRTLASLVGQPWIDLAVPEEQRAEVKRRFGLVAQGNIDGDTTSPGTTSSNGPRMGVFWER